MSLADPAWIPPTQAVLGLPYPLILHPGLVLTVTLSQAQCLGLLRTALTERQAWERTMAKDSESSSSASAKQKPMIVACLPVKQPHTEPTVTRDAVPGFAKWGCAARVLRLINMPSTDQCRLLLSGIVRVHVTSTRAARPDPASASITSVVLAPVAQVEVFHDPSDLTPLSQDASSATAELKGAALQLMTSMSEVVPTLSSHTPSMLAGVPLLPPSLMKRLTALLDTPDAMTSAMLADLLIGLLGGACTWDGRVSHLALVDPAQRIEQTVAMLREGMQRVQILRDLLANTPYALQEQHRNALIRAQIEAMVGQLAHAAPSGLSLRLIDSSPTSRALVPRKSGGPSILRRRLPNGSEARHSSGDDNDDMAGPMHDDDDDHDEVKALEKRMATAMLSDEARRVCEQELRRLKRMPSQSMERGVLINYLDTMLDLPWDRVSADLSHDELAPLVPTSQASVDGTLPLVARAREVLEADHYGLDKVKKRILEYLAVWELKTTQAGDTSSRVQYKGPILLLVGPPGTGKTSIARSLAAAMQRPFVRLSLGGVRDEAEIRGHRRTYVGALPGSIVASLRRARASDCVMLLDELDKLSSGMGVHGDPTAAMLEVLDPEQNHTFKDHYLNVPVDLSRVIFIATANSLDTIPEPLLDRVDTVQIAGYTHDEKVAIAQRHLVPKQIEANGLQPSQCIIDEDVLLTVAMSYTREAGVRTMERRIGDMVRAKAVEYAEATQGRRTSPFDPHIRLADLEHYLGHPTYEPEVADEVGVPGVATGLAYQGSGNGGILHIECAFLPPGKAALHLTGSLGDVIRESAELAFAWVKAHAFALGITASREADFPRNDVHLHMPSGATPKDGPSAGVAFVCALVSMYLRVSLHTRVAMTGEMTLRGHVAPVGGIKEKVLGAHRAGIHKIILPMRNQREWEADVPAAVRRNIDVVFVRTIQEALQAVFGASLEAQISTLYGSDEGKHRLQELEWNSRL
ncbi:serine-type endopeptidase [Malassezia pachydermatis]|uniref:endopeptidase La n=1 Tax=Malassezia pachydermatis TaxID=77020 RepID=A0A0M8MYK3_9BASI|nr:atp-dependent protease la [Malassezia pachydermatis]KOS16310.1 atp-dependent protease la [Malassezia pachydermatis]